MSKLSIGFRNGVIGFVVAGGLAAAAAAVAQVGDSFGPGMADGARPPWAASGGPGRMFVGNGPAFAQFQQERLANLKTQLAITPAQQPAWDAFAAKATEQAQALRAIRANAAAGTAQEWVALRGHNLTERKKAWVAMGEAREELHAALTPQQRELFDQSPGFMRRSH